ncbi:unnamed protein product [Phaedon cochleariae]|uniref:HECT domain-containing protein n=1 Tax=Phaedon cochleariae TaxID=80249 RepID=A0A9P0DL95_PHACE|nr:unnamed protein product [Phaedon cochleariae]
MIENIDCEAICAMTEDDLKEIIPAYGDRIAVKNFAKKNSSSTKQSLIEKLKAKFDSKPQKKYSRKTQISTESITKPTRIIEIGWLCMHDEENRYRQVRTLQGGGTRRVTIDKTSRCTDVLEMSKNLFFPEGVSTKGPITDFKVELVDYKSHKFDENLTVQEMYELSALGTLRFYLATIYTGKDGRTVLKDDDFIPATISTRRSARLDMRASTSSETSFTIAETSRGEASSFLSSFTPLFDEDFAAISSTGEEFVEDSNLFEFSEPATFEITKEINTLILHRGNIFEELINSVKIHGYEDFKNIKIEMILPNGNLEIAEDVGGVLRDTLTEFWESFYEKCSVGTHLKIPYLRHDSQEQEWRAIGKILANGYSTVGYFPIEIAPVFMMDCFGMEIDEEDIFLNFLKYICDTEAEIVKEAINSFDTIDMEELLEICSNYGCKWQPTKDNVKKLFNQIAAEELIQKPAFVKNCFVPELKKISSEIDLKNVYKQLEPSVKNILTLIESNKDISEAESEIMKFLRKFVKESDEKTRCSFLRYCTGSDLPTRQISIQFNDLDGVERVPVAHTCTGLLELSRSYENYVTFRSEFHSLLSSRIWVMDLV